MKKDASKKKSAGSPGHLHGSGLMGYISSKAPQPSAGYVPIVTHQGIREP